MATLIRKPFCIFLLTAAAIGVGHPAERGITVRLKGQLGNQMFQIATAYAQSRRIGCPYAVPDLVKSKDSFGISANHKELFSRVPTQARFSTPRRVHEKANWHYQTLPLTPGIDLDGYFQSERYFEDYADEVRALFAPRADCWRNLQSRYACLNDACKVGIHVRVYADRQYDTAECHPTFGCEYYKKAISECPDDATYIVCSNNISYAKNILSEMNVKFHFMETTNRFEDLQILSRCEYFIGSNSSFSWWAAWLGDQPARHCTFPFPWFVGVLQPADAPDLIPERWNVIVCPQAVSDWKDVLTTTADNKEFKH